MSDWHKKVYKKSFQDLQFVTVEWRILRDYVIKRDKMTCLRCDKKFPIKKLSVHHIIPRREGGSNDSSNLVTLCNECHDYVEVNELKTQADIMGSYDEPIPINTPDNYYKEDEYKRPEWHQWVYGGAKRLQA